MNRSGSWKHLMISVRQRVRLTNVARGNGYLQSAALEHFLLSTSIIHSMSIVIMVQPLFVATKVMSVALTWSWAPLLAFMIWLCVANFLNCCAVLAFRVEIPIVWRAINACHHAKTRSGVIWTVYIRLTRQYSAIPYCLYRYYHSR